MNRQMKLPTKLADFEGYKVERAKQKAIQTKKYLKPMPTDQPDDQLENLKKERSQFADTLERQVTGGSNRIKAMDQQSNLVAEQNNVDYNSMEEHSRNSPKELKAAAYNTQATKKSVATPRGPQPQRSGQHSPLPSKKQPSPSPSKKSVPDKQSGKPPMNRSHESRGSRK